MGMSTYVVGIKPPDEKWLAMKEAWDACKKAGISPPEAVLEFFNDVEPDPAGVIVEFETYNNGKSTLHEAVHEYKSEMSSGFEVDITKLPKDIKLIRFYNSW